MPDPGLHSARPVSPRPELLERENPPIPWPEQHVPGWGLAASRAADGDLQGLLRFLQAAFAQEGFGKLTSPAARIEDEQEGRGLQGALGEAFAAARAARLSAATSV